MADSPLNYSFGTKWFVSEETDTLLLSSSLASKTDLSFPLTGFLFSPWPCLP